MAYNGWGVCEVAPEGCNLGERSEAFYPLLYAPKGSSEARKFPSTPSCYLLLVFEVGINNRIGCDRNYRNKNEK